MDRPQNKSGEMGKFMKYSSKSNVSLQFLKISTTVEIVEVDRHKYGRSAGGNESYTHVSLKPMIRIYD